MSTKFTTDGSTWTSLASGPQGQPGPMGPMSQSRNRIINGDFSVNQREFTSFNFAGSTGYAMDQWVVSAFGGGSRAYHDGTGFAIPDIDYLIAVDTYSQNLSSHYSKIFQRIEDVCTLSGKQVTLSFWAKNWYNPSAKIGIEFYQYFSGVDGGLSTPAGRVTINNNWARYSITKTLPTLTPGMALVNSYLAPTFWLSAGSDFSVPSSNTGLQEDYIEITGIQLEEGPYATPFAKQSYSYELRSCQRYFQKWRQPPLRGVVNTTTFMARMGMILPVTMYKTPTYYMSGPLPIHDALTASTMTSLNTSFCTPLVVEWNATASPAFSAQFRTCQVYQSGSNYLDLSAEI